jgi:hypothetical protein
MERKKELLDNEETGWRLKSRAIWEEGDNNTQKNS